MFSEQHQTEYILSKLRSDETNLAKEKLEKAIKLSDSTESFIHVSEEEGEIYKVPKKNVEDALIRSYYIGKELNHLHSLIPNFVQTKQIHLKNREDNLFVAYEYVRGVSVEKMLTNNELTFSQFLNMFIQILFALELAQRYCMFCHYDLHLDNIIMKCIHTVYSYTLVLDDFKYDINANNYIPILIDFGFASSIIKNKVFGTHSFDYCGIMSYPIQGVDMYKLLFHSYVSAKGPLQKQIGGLFLFYGSYDPYKMLISSRANWVQYSKEYLKKASTSRIATFTPLEFLSWILENEEYSTMLTIKKSTRDVYQPLAKSLQNINVNVSDTKSYILNSYLEKITGRTLSNTNHYIQSDAKLLTKYKSIRVPKEVVIRDEINMVLGTPLGRKIGPTKHIDKANRYIQKILPYVHFLYTIRELHLEEMFKTFIDEFSASLQYKLYQKLCFIIQKTNRWLKTLDSF